MINEKILIVEPDQDHAAEIVEILKKTWTDLTVVHSHFKGLAMLEDETFSLVLVSADDSGIDGLEFCRIYRKRQMEAGRDCSYLIVSGQPWQRVNICENQPDCHDFLIRPYLECELEWRVASGFQTLREMHLLRQMLYFDPDTDSLNRLGIKKILKEEVNRLGRQHAWLSVAVLDFERRDWMEVNQGRDTVQRAKKMMLRFLSQSLRNYDHVGLIDQERICIISGDCDHNCFMGLMSRIDGCLKNFDFSFPTEQSVINLSGIYQSVMVDSTNGGSEACFDHLWTWIQQIVQLPEKVETIISYLDRDGLSAA
ncbi:MAG: diguanylate cyclase [Desulfonatronovibrio sp.]